MRKLHRDNSDAQTSTRWAAGGSVAAAITASACCLGPAAATLLGIGGFGAAAALAPWRPWFLGLTAVMLAIGFFLAYRRPKTACAEGTVCATTPAARWNRVLLWSSTALVVAFATFPYYSPAFLGAVGAEPRAAVAASAAVERVTIPVEGMTCPACPVKVQRALEEVRGVRTVRATYEPPQAVIEYDPAVVSRDDLVATINATGYRAGP